MTEVLTKGHRVEATRFGVLSRGTVVEARPDSSIAWVRWDAAHGGRVVWMHKESLTIVY